MLISAGKNIEFPLNEKYPTVFYAGNNKESLVEVESLTDLANKNAFKLVAHEHSYSHTTSAIPSHTVVGIANGVCECKHGTISVRLPILSDSRYTKAHHDATTEADGYDVYTYQYNGVNIQFTVNLVGTKISPDSGEAICFQAAKLQELLSVAFSLFQL